MFRSLYVHFPFCESRCHYCDFYSLGRERTKTDDHGRFEKALRTEALLRRDELAPELETIFFGGGTPSMTAYDSLARALEPLWEKTKASTTAEWTMEANPSSITLESMKAFRQYGVNRVSMGVQSMREDLLVKLGRVHSRVGALEALETVFAAGFQNVSVDLLCGVPGQTLEDLNEAITTLSQFPIQHLSCYLLTLPPHHKLYPELPNEETQLEHLLMIHRRLEELGFHHYEISNFARPGKESRHNLNYWQGASYLGLGPSAHSYCADQKKRFKNVSSLGKYASTLEKNELPVDFTETLTAEQRSLEKWMLALRLSEGFPLNWLTPAARLAKAQALQSEGLLETHPHNPERLKLTARGFALSDQVIALLA